MDCDKNKLIGFSRLTNGIYCLFFVPYSFTHSNERNMYVWFFYTRKILISEIFRTSNHPSVKWGQKQDHILLTIAVQDIEKPEISIEPTKLHFK